MLSAVRGALDMCFIAHYRVPSSYTLECATGREAIMTRTASFTTHAAKALSRRRTIPIELPEFAIRALEHRVEMTNAGADDEEMVSFNDVVEWYLLSPLSVKEMPHLEDAVPGFTAALVRWMIESTYSGAE